MILCSGWEAYEKAIGIGFQTFSLNLTLARHLIGTDNQGLSVNLTSLVTSLFPMRMPVYLIDYEMLFNPGYKLDIIRLFKEISRYNKLIVKWCGGFDGESLTYAEPGYDDYAIYKLCDYEITCVY